MHFMRILKIFVDKQMGLNWDKSHFMVPKEEVLGHVLERGLEVDNLKS